MCVCFEKHLCCATAHARHTPRALRAWLFLVHIQYIVVQTGSKWIEFSSIHFAAQTGFKVDCVDCSADRPLEVVIYLSV